VSILKSSDGLHRLGAIGQLRHPVIAAIACNGVRIGARNMEHAGTTESG
jgi:hypothetical protein